MSDDRKMPKTPRGLGKDGRKLWRSILADVADDWELDARDLAFLETACRAADVIAELEATVERDGSMIAGSRGQLIVNPAVAEMRQQRTTQTAALRRVELDAPPSRSNRSAAQLDQLAQARRNRWGPGAGQGALVVDERGDTRVSFDGEH